MQQICLFFVSIFVLFSLSMTDHADARSYSSRPASDDDILCKHIDQDGQVVPNAEYVAGVDVHGRKIASADVGGTQALSIPDPIIIPIELDIAQRYGLTLPDGLKLEPTISQIAVYKDGRILFNDQDITQKIVSHCHPETADKIKKKNADKAVQEHGQKGNDPVVSSDKIGGQYPDDSQERTPYNN